MTKKTQENTKQYYRYKFGPAECDMAALTLTVSNTQKRIEHRPLTLLAFLLSHPGEVFPKEELLNEIWPDKDIGVAVLPNAIRKIRVALGEDLGSRLVTVNKIGYRFDGPVERITVGQSFVGDVDLEVGEAVPGRKNYHLTEQLSATNERYVWRAVHKKSGIKRVFKLSNSAAGLSSLKREFTLYRLMVQKGVHTNTVTKIEDVNFETAPFYLECEDGGLDLKRWVNEAGYFSTSTETQRLDMIIRIIDIVGATHNAGVLHHDIKPSNILVSQSSKDELPELRLIDFGSGAAMNKDELKLLDISPLGLTRNTDDGQLQSTLYYTAPELLKGMPTSVQSDVYSLGVLAVQLLAGDFDLPITTSWQEKIQNDLLRKDLAMATHANPKMRWSSATVFTEQLRALNTRIAAATQAEIDQKSKLESEQLIRRARERRPWVVGALTALGFGIIGTSWFALQSNVAKADAVQQAKSAQASRDFLTEVLVSAHPSAPGTRPDATITTALERAYSIIGDRFSNEYATKEAVLATMVNTFGGINELEKQKQVFLDLIKLRSDAYGPDNPKVLVAKYQFSQVHARTGELDKAYQILEDADAIYAATQRMDPLVELHAALAKGQYYLRRLDFETSAKHYKQVEQRYHASGEGDLDLLWEGTFNLAQTHSRLGNIPEALETFETLQKEPFIGSSDVWRFRHLRTKQQYGATLVFAQRALDAIPILRQTASEFSEIYGPDEPLVSETNGILGSAYAQLKDWGNALALITEGREKTCNKLGEQNFQCFGAKANEAAIEIKIGSHLAALEKLNSVHKSFFEAFGANAAFVKWVDFQRASAWFEIGELESVGSVIDSITAQQLDEASPGDPWQIELDLLKGRYNLKVGNVEAGEEYLNSAIQKMQDTAGYGQEDITRVQSYLKNN